MLCCLVSESCQRWFGRGEVWVSFGYYARIAKKELWWLLSGFISYFLCVGFVLYSNINAYFLCRDLILAAILQGKYPSIYEGLDYSVFLHGLSFYFLQIHSHLSAVRLVVLLLDVLVLCNMISNCEICDTLSWIFSFMASARQLNILFVVCLNQGFLFLETVYTLTD